MSEGAEFVRNIRKKAKLHLGQSVFHLHFVFQPIYGEQHIHDCSHNKKQYYDIKYISAVLFQNDGKTFILSSLSLSIHFPSLFVDFTRKVYSPLGKLV